MLDKKDHSSLRWGPSQALDKDIMWDVKQSTSQRSDVILKANKRGKDVELSELEELFLCVSVNKKSV